MLYYISDKGEVTLNLEANVSLVEVEDESLASHVYIVDDHRNIGFTNGKLYELHMRETGSYSYEGTETMENYYLIDNKGNEAYSFLSVMKCKLCKLEVKL